MAEMEGDKKVKLLGFWVSPFSARVEWALKLKGVEYDYTEEDVFNKSPLLLRLNPVHKKVPVLVHDHDNRKEVVSESYVVLEYIDETWNEKNPLLPSDPFERNMQRFWAVFAEEKILNSAFKALIHSSGEEQEKYVTLTQEAIEHIEGEMKKINCFFGGESIGYLDITLGWIAYWLPVIEEVGSKKIMDPHKFPATAAWAHRFITHPLIKHNLPPRDKMVVYFRKRRETFTSSNHAQSN